MYPIHSMIRKRLAMYTLSLWIKVIKGALGYKIIASQYCTHVAIAIADSIIAS